MHAALAPAHTCDADSFVDITREVDDSRSGMALTTVAQNHPSVLVVDLALRQWAVQSGAVEEQKGVEFFDGKQVHLGGMKTTKELPFPATKSRDDMSERRAPGPQETENDTSGDQENLQGESSAKQIVGVLGNSHDTRKYRVSDTGKVC